MSEDIHAQCAPYEHSRRLLSCVQAWLKLSLGDQSMTARAVQDLTLDTLEWVMGQAQLALWLQHTPVVRSDTGREGEG